MSKKEENLDMFATNQEKAQQISTDKKYISFAFTFVLIIGAESTTFSKAQRLLAENQNTWLCFSMHGLYHYF